MKQKITLEIDVKEGYELKYNPETRIIEEVLKEPIRSKSWEEFCENHPNANNEYTVGICGISHADPVYKRCPKYHNQNLLATLEDAEGISALIQLTRLHDEWVGDWKPAWTTTSPPVWIIQITGVKNIVTKSNEPTYTEIIEPTYYVNRLLSFPSKEMAQNFLECFKDLIEKAKKFI